MSGPTSTSNIETTDRTVIHYETYGAQNDSRPSLLFLHYYGGSPATFQAIVSQLEGFHCVLYHSRGWAPSSGPDDPGDSLYGIEKLCSDLAVIINASSADNGRGFILIGHSMGAKVAQHYAASQPSPLLRGIFLLAPAPLFGLGLPEEAKEQQLAAYRTSESIRHVLDNVLTTGRLSEEMKQQCIADSMRGNEAATAAWPNYVADEDYSALQSQIEVPVVVLRGEQDFEVELLGLTLGSDHGWKNVSIPNCGHLIPLEQPDFLVHQVLSFVAPFCS